MPWRVEKTCNEAEKASKIIKESELQVQIKRKLSVHRKNPGV